MATSDNIIEMEPIGYVMCYELPYARHYKPGLYIFYPISKEHFFVFKEFFSENYVLMYDSRAVYNQERVVMAHDIETFKGQ